MQERSKNRPRAKRGTCPLQLESLEERLPPGDLLWGTIVSVLPFGLSACSAQAETFAQNLVLPPEQTEKPHTIGSGQDHGIDSKVHRLAEEPGLPDRVPRPPRRTDETIFTSQRPSESAAPWDQAVSLASFTPLSRSASPPHGPSKCDSWMPAASMAQARGFFSTTVLNDGQVLVAGGYVQQRVFSGVEVYNPDTDSWTETGSLQTARSGNGAALLKDGRVLVAGGLVYRPDGSTYPLDSAEIYDPATGQWSATGSMMVPRIEPFLTLLNDGRVLAAGETRAAGPLGKSAEIYDPGSGEWMRVADMSVSRSNQVQVPLAGGQVLVAGGYSGAEPGDELLASAEIYDPKLDTWTPTGDMTLARADAEPVVLQDGRVLISGGNIVLQPPTRTNTAEIYDPATGKWTPTSGAMSDAKVDHTMTLLSSGQVLAAGGLLRHDISLASADLYDPKNDTWTPVCDMAKSRGGHSAVLLPKDRVLVLGGLNFDEDTAPEHGLATTEIYQQKT